MSSFSPAFVFHRCYLETSSLYRARRRKRNAKLFRAGPARYFIRGACRRRRRGFNSCSSHDARAPRGDRFITTANERADGEKRGCSSYQFVVPSPIVGGCEFIRSCELKAASSFSTRFHLRDLRNNGSSLIFLVSFHQVTIVLSAMDRISAGIIRNQKS